MGAEKPIPNRRLKQARILKRLTQSELACEVGTNFETISKWERGISIPKFSYQRELVEVLGKTAEELGLLTEQCEEVLQPFQPGIAFVASYADREHEVCAQLKAELQVCGIPVIGNRSFKNLEWEQKQKRLREVFQATRIVLLLVSPHTRTSRYVQEALPIAKIYKCTIYAIWLAGECWQECLPPAYEDLLCASDVRASCDIEKIVKDLEQGWHAQQEIDEPLETRRDLPEPRNPYKGLRAFGNEDRVDFFGREQLIEELVGDIRVSLGAGSQNRLLAVVGPSGSGKSSVVLAGLMPCLQAGMLPGSAEWLYLEPMVPGQNPLESLAQTLAMFFPQKSLQTLREDLEGDSTRGLHLLASMIIERPEAKVLLCVDQFEEVFTQTVSEEEREQFLAVLMTAITEPVGPVILILTMRSDFDDRPMAYPRLSTLMEARRHAVLPMQLNELQMTIERPATHIDVQLTFEGTLMSDLLFDVYGQEGALPLLQFTLDLLFQKRSGHILTQHAYAEIGGVKGALAKHAEDTYQGLSSEGHRALARVLFLRLLDPGMTEQDTTRRRAAQVELVVTDPEQTAMLRETTNAFIRARLLTANDVASTSTIEVSHEALIREWKRISDWLRAAREDIRLQQTISKDVIEWERHRRSKDRLYRGSQLKEAKAWARRSVPSQGEARFLHASAVRRRRSLANVIAVFLLLMSTTGLIGWLIFRDPTHVTTLSDHGLGSLPDAIVAAKSGDTITFDPGLAGKTIVIHDSMYITKNLKIRGPAAGIISIRTLPNSGAYIMRVLTGYSVSITGLAFKNSKIIERPFYSGADSYPHAAIINDGYLTLINCIISGNNTAGITNHSVLTLSDSIISDNGSEGVYNSFDAVLSLQNSAVFNNGYSGISNSGTLAISNSTISHNTSGSATSVSSENKETITAAGGIMNEELGKLTIRNSIITHNTASEDTERDSYEDMANSATGIFVIIGGGIVNNGTLAISSSTISNNMSISKGKAFSKFMYIVNSGGGITNSGKLILTRSTLTSNKTIIHGFTRARFMSRGDIAKFGGKATITQCTISGNSNMGQG